MINKYDEKLSMDYENGYYLTSNVSRMCNLISHYELYKKIIDLPGDVIELGVFKGSSLIQFATFREILENEKSRKIIGFDMFGKFPVSDKSGEDDISFVKKFVGETNGEFLTIDELYKSFSNKNIGNVELVKGDIIKTLPQYIKENPYLRISFLHIDTDIYEPSKLGIELLFDRVVSNGIIVFDDYSVAGETYAVDEFLAGKNYILHKFPFSHHKPSFIIKK